MSKETLHDVVRQLDTQHLENYISVYEDDPKQIDRYSAFGRSYVCAVGAMLGGRESFMVWCYGRSDTIADPLGKMECLYEGWHHTHIGEHVEPIPVKPGYVHEERLARQRPIYDACMEELASRKAAHIEKEEQVVPAN